MDGIGSGHYRPRRYRVEECLTLSLPELRRLGVLAPNERRSATLTVSRGDLVIGHIRVIVHAMDDAPSWVRLTVTLMGETIEQELRLEAVPQPYGGHSWYALCPMTGRRCKTLLLAPGYSFFASRRGLGAAYTSQVEDAYGRAHRRAQKAQERLRTRSKYMRHPTRHRLWDVIWERDMMLDDLMARASTAVAGGVRLPTGALSRQTRQARGRDSRSWWGGRRREL